MYWDKYDRAMIPLSILHFSPDSPFGPVGNWRAKWGGLISFINRGEVQIILMFWSNKGLKVTKKKLNYYLNWKKAGMSDKTTFRYF